MIMFISISTHLVPTPSICCLERAHNVDDGGIWQFYYQHTHFLRRARLCDPTISSVDLACAIPKTAAYL